MTQLILYWLAFNNTIIQQPQLRSTIEERDTWYYLLYLQK